MRPLKRLLAHEKMAVKNCCSLSCRSPILRVSLLVMSSSVLAGFPQPCRLRITHIFKDKQELSILLNDHYYVRYPKSERDWILWSFILSVPFQAQE